jgi:hypothetical protein
MLATVATHTPLNSLLGACAVIVCITKTQLASKSKGRYDIAVDIWIFIRIS